MEKYKIMLMLDGVAKETSHPVFTEYDKARMFQNQLNEIHGYNKELNFIDTYYYLIIETA